MLKRIDLSRDYKAHEDEYLEAIRNVCVNTAFSGGRYADNFDKEFAEYLGIPFANGVNNGTSALHLAMLALGIGEGDEVIVPANTYIATAWGVTYSGATPVFVDCTPDTWEIDPTLIESKITSKTKAIIGVHLYGQPFDFDAVYEIAQKYNLYVVEDCAQAHGAEYTSCLLSEDGITNVTKKVGTLGEIGCFSFYPGKNLYAFGEGGSVTSKNKDYHDRITVYKNQGCAVRYYHDVVGYNYRMEGIQGAVLSVSLKYLPQWTEKRREIGLRYINEINNPEILMQAHPKNTNPVFHLFEIQVEDPEDMIVYMEKKGIECNRHYPVPCHLQEAYKNLGYKRGDCPNAEKLSDHCVTLPLFPEMTEEEVDMVIEACNLYRG